MTNVSPPLPGPLDLERAECAMYADLYAAVPDDLGRSHGVALEVRGHEHRFLCAAVNHPFFNRVMGIGMSGETLDDAWLSDHLERFGAAGIERYMLQTLPEVETDSLRATLRRHALGRLRGWAKHAGRPVPVPAHPTDLRIEEIGVADAAPWASICAEGFSFPRELSPWLERLAGRPGWRLYLAFDGTSPVASAALFIDGAFATLTFAATRPEARRRGAQGALIERRVADAAAAGVRWMVTETDEEEPDRPNPSYHNVVRLGFPALFVRPNWGPRA